MKYKLKFINLTILVISSLITLFIIEAFLIIIEKKNSIQRSYVSKFEFIKNYKNKNTEIIFPAYHPDFNENNNNFIPLGDISFSKIALCNESGDWSIFNSDRYGFNNYDDVWDDNHKILLIGDSYVQGACVNQDEIISNQIMGKTDLKVLSVANSKTGPISQLGLLQEYIGIIKPKKLIWFYYEGNDFSDLKFEKKNLIAKNYINILDQNLVNRQDEINKKLITYSKNFENVKENKMISFIKFYKTRSFINNLSYIFGPYSNEDLEIYKSILKKFKKITFENNSELYIVYVPSYYRFSMPNILKKYNKNKVINLINNENITLIDLTLIFNKDNYKSFYPHGQYGHFNANGYAKIADKIISTILK